jgi:hypothetical protein
MEKSVELRLDCFSDFGRHCVRLQDDMDDDVHRDIVRRRHTDLNPGSSTACNVCTHQLKKCSVRLRGLRIITRENHEAHYSRPPSLSQRVMNEIIRRNAVSPCDQGRCGEGQILIIFGGHRSIAVSNDAQSPLDKCLPRFTVRPAVRRDEIQDFLDKRYRRAQLRR